MTMISNRGLEVDQVKLLVVYEHLVWTGNLYSGYKG